MPGGEGTAPVRAANRTAGEAAVNANRNSDECVVPSTQANNAGTEPAAESVEERDSAKMNTHQPDRPRTLSRIKRRSRGLAGVREAARAKPALKFENLLHHRTVPLLHEAFDKLKKSAAAGIDDVTWQDYEQDREASIVALHGRIHRGYYRAKPSKRIHIPKTDGRQRPIGIAALEDKIVQKATVWGMLKNPAHTGSAAFGKTRIGPRRPQLKTQRGHSKTPRRTGSTYDSDSSEQLEIAVPAIVCADLFAAVATQLTENRQRGRESRRGAKYLLQDLLECTCCGYAFYGKPVSRKSAKGKVPYAYYRCIGSDACRFGGTRIVANQQLRTDKLEEAVWQDASELLRY